jgi:hypothetical protein
MQAQTPQHKLILVSNRLPVTIHREGDKWQFKASSGGEWVEIHNLLEVWKSAVLFQTILSYRFSTPKYFFLVLLDSLCFYKVTKNSFIIFE